MKKLTIALLGTLLFAASLPALDVTSADKKWCEVIEAKIAKGPAEISTPSEVRVQLAKDLAAQKGRQCQVTKVSGGYRIVIK